jgi:hypothetical protein
LTVDDRGAGFGITPDFLLKSFAKRGIDWFPSAVIYPCMIRVTDHRIMGKIFRRIPPLATGFIEIKNRIDDLAKIDFTRTSSGMGIEWFENGLQDFPFFIRQIAGESARRSS